MKEKVENDPARLRAPHPFSFWLHGGQYRKTLLVAINKLFLPIREDSSSLEIWFLFSLFRGPARLWLSDSSQILYNHHLWIFSFRKKQSPYFYAPIYLILALPDTISTIPTPYPLSRVQLSQALRFDCHISSSTD